MSARRTRRRPPTTRRCTEDGRLSLNHIDDDCSISDHIQRRVRHFFHCPGKASMMPIALSRALSLVWQAEGR